jgi:hypothetical protein
MLLRQSQNLRALQLFGDLYRFHDLVANGGVHWYYIRQRSKRYRVGGAGPFAVWAFAWEDDPTLSTQAPFVVNRLLVGRQRPTTSELEELWSAFNLLRSLGLVAFVGHLVDAETAHGEMIHAFDTEGTGEEIENEIATAARSAGRLMVSEGQYKVAAFQAGHQPDDEDLPLVPVLRHIENVALVGVVRLRYRPRTAATATWYARLQEQGAQYIARYEALSGKDEPFSSESAYDRLRTSR